MEQLELEYDDPYPYVFQDAIGFPCPCRIIALHKGIRDYAIVEYINNQGDVQRSCLANHKIRCKKDPNIRIEDGATRTKV